VAPVVLSARDWSGDTEIGEHTGEAATPELGGGHFGGCGEGA
jgi:hypothetical protein